MKNFDAPWSCHDGLTFWSFSKVNDRIAGYTVRSTPEKNDVGLVERFEHRFIADFRCLDVDLVIQASRDEFVPERRKTGAAERMRIIVSVFGQVLTVQAQKLADLER